MKTTWNVAKQHRSYIVRGAIEIFSIVEFGFEFNNEKEEFEALRKAELLCVTLNVLGEIGNVKVVPKVFHTP